MSIELETLKQIENVIRSAKLVDISELIIDKNMISGINSTKTAFVLSVPDLPDDFETLAINRPDVYLSRFSLVKDSPGFKSTIKIKSGAVDFVEQINFSSKQFKVQYRCCTPSMISAPKSINDTFSYVVKFTSEDVDTLLKACTSIDTENIKLSGTQDGLTYKLIDLSGDIIDIDSDSQIESTEDTFTFNYSFVQKPFLQLLKNCDSLEFELGKKGILKIKVNNIYFYLMPQV